MCARADLHSICRPDFFDHSKMMRAAEVGSRTNEGMINFFHKLIKLISWSGPDFSAMPPFPLPTFSCRISRILISL